MGDGTPEAGVQSSTDGGGVWTLGAVGLPGVYEPNPRFLSVSPRFADDQSVFTMLKGDVSGEALPTLFRSYDGGATWADQFAPPNSVSVNDAVATYAPTEGVRIHLATTAGVMELQPPLCANPEQPGLRDRLAVGARQQASQPARGLHTDVVYAGLRAARLGVWRQPPTPTHHGNSAADNHAAG